MEYKVTTSDIEHFIADWLNSEHENYATYVKGIKLFVEYLEERNAKQTKD